jgi:hypothetical protein
MDATGRRLGTVARIHLAVPQVTHPPDSDLLDDMVAVAPSPPEFGESAQFETFGASPVGHDPAGLAELPEPLREHLRRVGFFELGGSHLSEAQRFVPGDQIETVSETAVVLRGENR